MFSEIVWTHYEEEPKKHIRTFSKDAYISPTYGVDSLGDKWKCEALIVDKKIYINSVKNVQPVNEIFI